MLRVGWDGSTFDNNVESVTWDNPLRYGPDIAGAPSQGRMALWPDNTLTYLHGTGAVSLPGRGRLTGYAAFGQGRSNETCCPSRSTRPFAPPSRSRAPTAEAENQMTIAQFTLAMRPTPRASRSTRSIAMPTSMCRRRSSRARGARSPTTRAFNAIAGPSEYHSVKRMTFDADGAFQVAPSTSLKVGYSQLGSDYTHRIWEKTDENVFRVRSTRTGNQRVHAARACMKIGSAKASTSKPKRLPKSASWPACGTTTSRIAIARASPSSATRGRAASFELTASAGVGRDEYPRASTACCRSIRISTRSAFTMAPDDRYNLTASYGWEDYTSLQRSRNANSAASRPDPIRDWTTDYTGKVNFLEAGFDINGASSAR